MVIPINEPVIGQREMEYVTECLRTGWVSSMGAFLSRFEEQWAAYCDRKYGVAVSSGLAALQLAVTSLDLRPGDEVILPTFTIISCALAVVYGGGVPVLVDADPRTWCMDVGEVERKITPRTRAIMPVHIYGHPVDMDPLLELAQRHGLAVIEDAAEAHGAEYLAGRSGPNSRWRRCGSFGTLSCFSFYANKIITTGEGGMVLTDDPQLAETIRSLRDLCYQRRRRFLHERLGHNFRMTNMQAALGLGQVERVEQIVAGKRRMGQEYNRRLADIPGLSLPAEEPWARNIYWMYALLLTDEAGPDAAAVAERLRERGVDTRPFFVGMHEQPALRNRGLFVGERYPVADRLSRWGLQLPSGVALTDRQLEQVCETMHEVLS
jgi:perosamine synthetase